MNKTILINAEAKEKRIAVIENGRLEEYYVERSDHVHLAGNIYKGKVQSVIPGIQAAFVELGLPKNGFLYVSDLTEPTEDATELFSDAVETGIHKKGPHPEIQNLLHKEQEVLVQIIKEPIGTKGARLSTHISLPGRYLVLMPLDNHIGVSKRIESDAERNRLNSLLKPIVSNRKVGVIVRTVSQGCSKRDLIREFKYLVRIWHQVQYKASRSSSPSLIHEESDLIARILRDSLTKEVDKLIIDSRDEHRKISQFVNSFLPEFKSRVELYQDVQPLFEKFNLEKEIEKIYEPKIYLKCGGYIIIEPTEGLVVIDVNTGKFLGKRNPEETVFRANLEAAEEIARQLRLRDMGGIIVIDFIDMKSSEHRRKVQNVLEDALKRDRAKLDVSHISQFGLVEMTRQRVRQSLESATHDACPTCHGRGVVKSMVTRSIEVLRDLKKKLRETNAKTIHVSLYPALASYLLNDERQSISALEQEFRAKIFVHPDSAIPLDEIIFK